jgi:outer membrane protein with beta-barrel domain
MLREFLNRLLSTAFMRLLPVTTLAIALVIGAAREARAQVFISPFFASSFGGNVGCQRWVVARPGVNCVDGSNNFGVTVGAMWHFIGFEEEVAYRPDVLGNIPTIGLSSGVLTLMSNVMLAPEIGPVRPYVLGGIGLIHPRITEGISFRRDDGIDGGGWDVGGGVMVFFGKHVGVRGDIRYIRAFQTLVDVNAVPGDGKLDFGPRANFGLVLKF